MPSELPHAFNVPTGVYLHSHSVGAMPTGTEDIIAEHFTRPWATRGNNAWPEWLEGIERFRGALARLLGGASKDFCPQANLSGGICKYLMALPQTGSERSLLMHATAFPSMGFVGTALAKLGWRLTLIDAKYCAADLNAWREHMTDDVAAVVITHAHSNTSALSPVAELVALCREKGKKALVDIAQTAGITPINLLEWQADAVFGSCVKWLCGGPGAGYMWVNPNSLDELTPVDVGWFSHANPFELDITHFEYAADALRFWGGTPSIVPYIIAANSIDVIRAIGVEKIALHNQNLSAAVLLQLCDTVLACPDVRTMGATLCLQYEPKGCVKAAEKLRQINAHFDCRDNTLRMSFHIYNTMEEAAMVIDVLGRGR